MDLIDKGTDEEEYESVHNIILYGFVNNKAQTLKVGSIDAIDGDNKHLHGYYMVGFLSSPYTLQENKTIDGN